MSRIRKEIIESLESNDFNYSTIRGAQANALIDKIKLEYIHGEQNYPFWDNLAKWVGVDYAFSWEWLPDLIRGTTIYLFTDQDDLKEEVFIIDNGDCLPEIMEACSGFTFYITDSECNYLVCYNDHDNLIASGTAIDWLLNFEIVKNNKLTIYSNT